MALQSPVFPIDQPVMPEERQIGRRVAIDTLHARIGGAAAAHQWLVGPRRTGKTSVAKAVLARLRAEEGVALDVDLSKLDISSPQGLTGELARQAQAARAGVSRPGRRLFGRAGRHAPDVKRLSSALNELGIEDEAEALAAVAALLAGADDGGPGLDSVLEALALHARGTCRRVVVLFDEVHLLAELDGCEQVVARWAREADCPIVFVFAGSEESAVRELREAGRPLAPLGQEFHLPDISTEDWVHGLRRRFHEAGVAIADEQLFAIVEASDGHPRRTMLVARYVHSSVEADRDRTATDVGTQLAIRNARSDRSWN